MKLEKAIKIGKHKVSQNVFQVDPDALTALKLLIEAGKRIINIRHIHKCPDLHHLPGETKE